MTELHSKPYSTVEPYTGWSQIPGILNMEKTQEIIREFCATSGKNCNKMFLFVIQIFV